MGVYINIVQIILAIALVAAIVLQSKGAGLGGITGGDSGGTFRTRRGIEKLLFQITIGLSIAFFLTAIINVIATG